MKRYLIGLIAVIGLGCSSHETKPTAEATPVAPAFPQYEEAGSLTWKESRGPASNAKCAKAVERIRQAGCYLSNNDEDRIKRNGDICKHIESGSGKTEMEVILLEHSDKVVTVTTRGAQRNGNWCPTVKYDVDGSGISDVKIIKNKAYMVSNDGQVYFMYTDGSFYELLNSSRNSYKSVSDIKGIDGGTGIKLIFRQGKPLDIDDEKFADKINDREARRLNFYTYSSNESLFRDR